MSTSATLSINSVKSIRCKRNSWMNVPFFNSLILPVKELGLLVCCLSALTFLFFPVFARADTIYLKSGKHFEGIVVRKDDQKIVFDVIMGADRMRMSFSLSEVERVDKASAGAREALEREVMRGKEEREKLEEEMGKQGLVLYRGKWVTEEERRRAEEERKREVATRARQPSKRPVAPKFDLPDLDGNLHSMDQYRGQLVLLFFWASGSRTSAHQIHVLKRAYKKYRDEGLVVLGISLDTDKGKARNFVNTRKVDFPILCDGEGWKSRVVKQYGVRKLPSTFLIDRAGYVRASGILGEYIGKEIDKLLNR